MEKIVIITEYLSGQKKPFVVEKNYKKEGFKADLYGFRRYSFMGHDYIFIHIVNGSQLEFEMASEIHEAERSYVNSLYNWPRTLRLKVPNIITVFVSEFSFPEETVMLASQNGRPWQGGEIHTSHFIDMHGQLYYGPGQNTVHVKGGRYTFKETDPQNRSLNLIKGLSKKVFDFRSRI